MEEVWLPVKGYEDYYKVSNLGRVWSKKKDKERATFISQGGYLHLDLFSADGKHKNATVHRMIAEAFIPNPNNLPVVNHIDGNKLNNQASNLEWCTISQNTNHAVSLGLFRDAMGENNSIAKLKNSDVIFIRTHFKSPFTASELSKKYNVSISTIYKISQNKIWSHV